MSVRILVGDVMARLADIADESVHCVVTSPPYFGLRSYSTEPQVWGGAKFCVHAWEDASWRPARWGAHDDETPGEKQRTNGGSLGHRGETRDQSICGNCQAWRGSLGLEPTPDLFIEHLVAVFREVGRVLRPEGTLWLNIASSYASSRLDSDQFVIKRSLPADVRVAVAKALSAVWSGYASTEQAVQELLCREGGAAEELHRSDLREVQQGVPCSYLPCGEGTGELLLDSVRPVGEPEQEASDPANALPALWENGQKNAGGYAKEPNREGVLLTDLLVRAQPAGPPLFVGRRTRRADEPPGESLAQGCVGQGPRPLPPVFLGPSPGGSPHQAVPKPPRDQKRSVQRDNALPVVPQAAWAGRDVDSGRIGDHSQLSSHHLAGITFPKTTVPKALLPWCEAASVTKPKDDLAIPSLLVLALRADGWYLRSEITWAKKSPMPESVRDRPTSATEKIFLLTKSPNYFYDSEAVAEPCETDPKENYPARARVTGRGQQGFADARGNDRDKSGGFPPRGRAAGNKTHKYVSEYEASDSEEHRTKAGLMKIAGTAYPTRNQRNFWLLGPEPFPDAHFATFVTEIPRRAILAGSSAHGVCAACGAPHARVVDKQFTPQQDVSEERGVRCAPGQKPMDASNSWGGVPRGTTESVTTGWRPTCKCDAGIVPATILDPFAGACTTLMVADRLGRNAIGIELSEAYANMGAARIKKDGGFLSDVRIEGAPTEDTAE